MRGLLDDQRNIGESFFLFLVSAFVLYLFSPLLSPLFSFSFLTSKSHPGQFLFQQSVVSTIGFEMDIDLLVLPVYFEVLELCGQ